MTESTKSATMTIDGRSYDLPMFSPTAGPDVVDIRKLYGKRGVFTYDPGFTSTAACDSTITFIDGEKASCCTVGIRSTSWRANPTTSKSAICCCMASCPSRRSSRKFEATITHHTMIHEQMHNFFRGFRRDAHPMATMVGVVGAMSAFYHDSTDITDEYQREVASHRLIAKMPTIAAMAYKYTIGQPFVYPRNDLDYAANFLHMCFLCAGRRVQCRTRFWRAPWTAFSRYMPITNKTRPPQPCAWHPRPGRTPLLASRRVSRASGGPAHGGANQACLEMLKEIGTPDRIPEFIARAKDKNDPFRLMGFGHRVYKNHDPRATVMKKSADEVLELLGVDNNPILQVAKELESRSIG